MNSEESLKIFTQNNWKDGYSVFDSPEAITLLSLFKRKIPNKKKYYNRLAKEIYLVIIKKFTKVFVQVQQILELAGDVPHIIRGSAGSSLICYLMKITNIDPIAENISLARFLHQNRKDYPDIDIDFPWNQREMIFKKITDNWNNQVARISNHINYKPKSALREAIREEGYRKFIPRDFELEEIFSDPVVCQRIRKRADQLVGTMRCHSLHCGGIIIFDDKVPTDLVLKEYKIFRKDKNSQTGKQIKMNKDQVEDAGYIKIDILSNRGLGMTSEISPEEIENYPQGDKLTYQLLARGDNLGIVYSESRAMRKILMTMKPNDIGGIAEALALIRPAAARNYQKNQFLKDYSPVMKNREAFIIYDDDAIQFIQKVLGCNDSLADIFRKGFAKKDWKLKNKFKKWLVHKNPTMTLDDVELVFGQLERLEEYSFCKSHAISYAKLVYALAYLKANHPLQFWLAALNNCKSSYRKWVHFHEAQVAGLVIKEFGRAPWKVVDQSKWEIIGQDLSGRNKKREKPKIKLNLIRKDQKVNQTKNDQKEEKKKIRIPIKSQSTRSINSINNRDSISDFVRYGWWLGPKFLPGMYYRVKTMIKRDYYTSFGRTRSKQTNLDDLIKVGYFKGIIATGRGYTADKKMENGSLMRRAGRKITFLTLGYDNSKYIDIVLWGSYKIQGIIGLEGHGIIKDDDKGCQWIEVIKWKYLNI